MRALTATSMAVIIGLSTAAVTAPEPGHAQGFIGVSVRLAPPPLPIYAQPPIPGYGYIWSPGYWAWDEYSRDYYWVPGCWIEPPAPQLLWTPGYWAWENGAYAFNAGYWGLRVGFYGGINYGFGYTGAGYVGGYWDRDHFHYNSSVNNISGARISSVYSSAVAGRAAVSNVSFNGGPGGVRARATPRELAAARENHVPATAAQLQQRHLASTLPALRAAINHGRPPIAATPRAAVMRGPGVVPAAQASPNHRPVAVPAASAGRTSQEVSRSASTHFRTPRLAVPPASLRTRQSAAHHATLRQRLGTVNRPRNAAPVHAPPAVRPGARQFAPARVQAHAPPRSFAPARMAAQPRAAPPSASHSGGRPGPHR